MIVIIDIFFGILIVVGALILLGIFTLIIEVLKMAFRYIFPRSGADKVRNWVASHAWISKLGDTLLLLLILVTALIGMFIIGQSFTGNP